MRKIGFLSLFWLVLGLNAALAEERVNLNVPAGGAQDLLNMTRVPTEISDNQGDHTIQRACTNSSGRVIQQNQDGYEECLAALHSKKTSQSEK